MHLPACFSIYLSFFFSSCMLFYHLSFFLSICLTDCLPEFPLVYILICLHAYRLIRLSICPFNLSMCPFVYLSICLYANLSVSQSVFWLTGAVVTILNSSGGNYPFLEKLLLNTIRRLLKDFRNKNLFVLLAKCLSPSTFRKMQIAASRLKR